MNRSAVLHRIICTKLGMASLVVALIITPVPTEAAGDSVQTELAGLERALRNGNVSALTIYMRSYRAGDPTARVDDASLIKRQYHFVCRMTLTNVQRSSLAESIQQTTVTTNTEYPTTQWGIEFAAAGGETVSDIYLSRRFNEGIVFGTIAGQKVQLDDTLEQWSAQRFPGPVNFTPGSPYTLDERCMIADYLGNLWRNQNQSASTP